MEKGCPPVNAHSSRVPTRTDGTDSANRRHKLSRPALEVYFNICAKWGLTTRQMYVILGRPPKSTFYRWYRRRNGRLSKDLLERISYVVGIYGALHALFSTPEQANGWIKRPNADPTFGGASALDRMMGGNVTDLYVVRRYLETQRDFK